MCGMGAKVLHVCLALAQRGIKINLEHVCYCIIFFFAEIHFWLREKPLSPQDFTLKLPQIIVKLKNINCILCTAKVIPIFIWWNRYSVFFIYFSHWILWKTYALDCFSFNNRMKPCIYTPWTMKMFEVSM